jgi:hypothetical protein
MSDTLFDLVVAAVIPMLEPGPKRSAIARRAAHAAISAASGADDTVVQPIVGETGDPVAFKALLANILL